MNSLRKWWRRVSGKSSENDVVIPLSPDEEIEREFKQTFDALMIAHERLGFARMAKEHYEDGGRLMPQANPTYIAMKKEDIERLNDKLAELREKRNRLKETDNQS